MKRVRRPLGNRRDFTISEDTTFIVTAYDTNGLTATREIEVKVKQPPQPDLDENSDDGPPPNSIGD